MKAMAMVAHPDDCVIFAYSFMKAYPNFEWTVCYLTYTADSDRGREFVDFWKRRGVVTRFLGYVDDWHDIERQSISFDLVQATQDIALAIQDQDLVLTHSHTGDYGHLHHKFVCHAVCEHHNRVVTFAAPGQGNVKYSVETGAYQLDELPLHRDVIQGFHSQSHANEYAVSERVKKIL